MNYFNCFLVQNSHLHLCQTFQLHPVWEMGDSDVVYNNIHINMHKIFL
jgi:hypothetical protein